MRWDEWRGSMDGRPTLWVKCLFGRSGRRIDIHKMVAADDPDCFHSHPAYAVRIILWGGYVEQVTDGRWRMWLPGMIGIVRPSYAHRIAGFRNGRNSYSLWIRFRKIASIELHGDGWSKQQQLFRAPETAFAASPPVAEPGER